MLQVRMNNGKAILQVRNLRVTFQEGLRKKSIIRAVNNVSFDLEEGEVLSLVGESGSGKTTIARTIAALNPATSGEMLYKGTEVSSLRGKDLLNYRREVQVVFQDPYESLNPRWDVFTTIATHLRYLGEAKNKPELQQHVSQILQEVGLQPEIVLHRLPHQLSGGERQRVNIARALSPNPKLLLADEPITMLDASQRLNILKLLIQLKEKRNLTVMLITHDLASANVTSDRTFIMYRGNLVEAGPTQTVLSRPHHPYTALILSSMPDIEARTKESDGEIISSIDEKQIVTQGCIFRPRCKYSTEICARVEPELVEKSPNHLCACHNFLN
ncbi:MAG: ABC transporter ATP-binding protein [Thaumarchaeota archaeon]|nr:ABC transporter ATP-binding protein [Nitrososphaerota archaeon]